MCESEILRERERESLRLSTLMPDVFMCIYVLVSGEGGERVTSRGREVYKYKYTHAQREGLIEKARITHARSLARTQTHTHTHTRDIKRKREACACVRARAHTHTHFQNSLNVSLLCAGDTCGTSHRHLAGAAPHSDSYVAPLLSDRLVDECSLPDIPSCVLIFEILKWD